jgi:hypothetical protein
MKKSIIILFFFTCTAGISQHIEKYKVVQKWNSPFGSNITDSTIIKVQDSTKEYIIHHVGGVTAIQTMEYAQSKGWVSIVPKKLSVHIGATPTPEIRVPNANTTFEMNIPVGTGVYDLETKKYYKCDVPTDSTATLTTAASHFTFIGGGLKK